MSSKLTQEPCPSITSEERDQVRLAIAEALAPIAPFWPMKTFAYYNPIRGLEHLHFDEAIQKASSLRGGNGYLPNDQYRRLYQEGRITEKGIQQALQALEIQDLDSCTVHIRTRSITVRDIWRLHLIFGIDSLDPVLLTWKCTHEGALTRFRHDLPAEVEKRIIERTIRECETCRKDPIGTYLNNLWKSTLSVLELFDPVSQSHPPHPSFTARKPDSPDFSPSADISLPDHQTLSDWIGRLSGKSVGESINEQMIKWVGAFVDEGLANWEMPVRHRGFYEAWQNLAGRDHSCRFLGIDQFARKVQDLPLEPEEAVVLSLNHMKISHERWSDYLSRHLAQLSGWAGFIRWRGEHPYYPAQRQHSIDPVQYLAVRLFFEKEFCQAVCQQTWGIDGTLDALNGYWRTRYEDYAGRMGQPTLSNEWNTQAVCRDAWRIFHLAQFLELAPLDLLDFSRSEVQTLLRWLNAFPSESHGPVWLDAYEDAYREELIQRLIIHPAPSDESRYRPRAQVIFCIDARSEPFRRHLEAQGPYETFGYAGFFGIPINHAAFDTSDHMALCPILLTPKHEVSEVPRDGQDDRLERYVSGTRWLQLSHHLFHDLKHNPIGSFILIDVLGVFFSMGLVGKTLFGRFYHRIKTWIHRFMVQPVATHIPIAHSGEPEPKPDSSTRLVHGFTLEEQVAFIEGGLRMIGLTQNFGRFIVACGHGSLSDNNPYFSALDCGACGGSHGDPNARVFAAMANNGEVRRLLQERGLLIPDDTWFLAGKHNTTTDRVTFYDQEEIPASHMDDWHRLIHDLEQAGSAQALERCQRLPQVSPYASPEKAYAHVAARSVDWANPRPEWGLSGNAAFIIGRRALTKCRDLQGRVFLHSYAPDTDADGALLEKIMTAPLIVGELISLTYYFSAVDPWVYGSGSKVIHNVVAGIGVMLGSQSDLRIGLPLQSVNDGALHYHEPMRLLTVIEAPLDRISRIIQHHENIRQLFHNRWMNLVALDPGKNEFHQYNPDGTWEILITLEEQRVVHD